MNNSKYYLAAIVAYATWGFFSLVLKPLAAYPSIDLLFYRVFSCALLMLLIVVLFKRKAVTDAINVYKILSPKRRRKVLMLNIGGSLLLSFNWFSFIYVMNHVSVKAASLAYLVCPVLTTVLAFFLLNEKLSRLQWGAVALSLLSCLLLSYANITDMFYSILVGLSYAGYLVSQRRNVGFDKFLTLTFHIVLSAIMLLPFYPAFGGPFPTEIKFYVYIETIAVFFTIMPLFLNLYALRALPSSTLGMLLNINPIIGFTLAALVYKEQISAMQIVAYSLILIAVVVFNVRMMWTGAKKKVTAK
ncbi:EamA family transporter [Mucilaginibacter auburnensis]|uniref:Chloramphenicol-sensitive protein RarD n=1 Tax=Mucilaginibacter auburnensis TaxID=1457233 RepID=A0A2H9VPX6_9SPHI|nr:EamA family transporter [Mucilaginibacter auburnensis]PJJ80397.1 chloramphenicol-sensitive protein RarD [Mucilaginibacter auburnensis]